MKGSVTVQNIIGKILLFAGFIVVMIGILLSIILMSNRAITTDYGTEYVQVDGGFIIFVDADSAGDMEPNNFGFMKIGSENTRLP